MITTIYGKHFCFLCDNVMPTNKSRVEQKCRNPFPSGKECWSLETIRMVLRNEKYTGDVKLQKFMGEIFGFCLSSLSKKMHTGTFSLWINTTHAKGMKTKQTRVAELQPIPRLQRCFEHGCFQNL